MRILLVSLNRVSDPFPVFPLGMAYLADALKAAGHEVRLHDLLYQSATDLESTTRCFQPDLVGFSLRNIDNVRADQMVSYVTGLRDLARRVRAIHGARIVVGGAGFSIFPDEILSLMEADYGLCGEGEHSFPLLVEALANGRTPNDIPGLVYWESGRIRRSTCLPVPLSHHAPFDPDPTWVSVYRERGAVFNVQSQRGCPLHCCYCTYPLIEGKRRRLRDYGRIVEELRKWKSLGVNYVFFVDSVLNTSLGHLRGLGEALLEADTGVKWGCFLRPQVLPDEDLALLVRSGLKHVEFGSDSFSDPVLKAYGKSFDFATIKAASEQAQAAGIHFCHFLIFGGPGETEETMETSFDRSEKLKSDVFFAFPGMRVYPHTPLWNELKSRGITLPDNLLEPYFFIEEGLSVQKITARMRVQGERDPRWIPMVLPKEYEDFVQKLRARRVEGPLWEYFTLLNRFARN